MTARGEHWQSDLGKKRLSNTDTCTLFVSWYSQFHCALPDKVTHNQSTSTQDPHCKWVQHETNHWWDLTTKKCIHHDQEPQLIPPLAINHTNTYKIFLTRTFSMVKRILNTFHCVAFIGKKCLHQYRACSQIFSTRKIGCAHQNDFFKKMTLLLK